MQQKRILSILTNYNSDTKRNKRIGWHLIKFNHVRKILCNYFAIWSLLNVWLFVYSIHFLPFRPKNLREPRSKSLFQTKFSLVPSPPSSRAGSITLLQVMPNLFVSCASPRQEYHTPDNTWWQKKKDTCLFHHADFFYILINN